MNNKYLSILNNITSDSNNLKLNTHKDSKILIIDSMNTFIRNFTMVNTINPSGHHIGGLIGFLKSIGYAIKIIQPTKVILVFDGKDSSNTKKNLYSNYKANRNPNRVLNYKLYNNKEEEELSSNNQMERLVYYLKTLPVNMVCIDSIEADDIIGYLTNKYENNPNTDKITIMSADQDFLQLISNKTNVYSPVKKIIYDLNIFKKEFNINSYNYIIYKTFLGDKGDNVPKIKSFGEDKLFKLLPIIKDDKVLTLEECLESIDKNDKWGIKLLNFQHQLKINYQLMNLKEYNISKNNIEIIENSISSDTKLDKYRFLSMYYGDKLGDSISNVEIWINEVFGYLNLV